MPPLRIALIGFGRWGRILYRNLMMMPDMVPAAVGTRQMLAAEDRPVCPIHADWREMLRAPQLDGVIVATSPASHAEIVAASLAAGLPVFVEKPLTMDVPSAEALVAQAQAAGLPLMVDHVHLFSPAFRQLKQEVAKRGGVTAIESCGGNHGPYRADVAVLWDWGPHDVAMLLDLMGSDPDSVRAQRTGQAAMPGGTAESIELTLDFGAVRAVATLSTMIDKTRTFSVQCGSETLCYDDIAVAKLSLFRDGARWAIDLADKRSPLQAALGEFGAAIRDRDVQAGDPGLAARVVRILAAADDRLRA